MITMALLVQIVLSSIPAAGVLLIDRLIHQRLTRQAHEEGIDWPPDDAGIEVSPKLMNLISLSQTLHSFWLYLMGLIFCVTLLLFTWLRG